MSQSALEELRGLLEKGSELQTKDPALEALLKLNLTPDYEMVKNVHVRACIIMQADRIFKEEKLKGKRTTEGLKLYPLIYFRGFAYEAASLIEADYRIKDVTQHEKEISQAFDKARFAIIDNLVYPLRHVRNKAIYNKIMKKGFTNILRELDRMREKIRIEPLKKTDLKNQLFKLLQNHVPENTPEIYIDGAIIFILILFGIVFKTGTALRAIQRKAKKELTN